MSSRKLSPSGLKLALALLTLVAINLIVYGQVIGFDFSLWDDQVNVVENPQLDRVTSFWTRPYAHMYAPLTYTFFLLESKLAARDEPDELGRRFDPAVFHAGVLLLHLGCVALVFFIVRRLVDSTGAALLGAALFSLHPLQAESIAWITETKGRLSALFGLAALWFYLKYAGAARGAALDDRSGTASSQSAATPQQWKRFAVATGFLIAALLSKPSAAAVPLVAAVLDLGFLRRGWRATLPGLAIWAVLAGGVAYGTARLQPSAAITQAAPEWMRPLVALDALSFYANKLFWPVGLAPDYGRTPAEVLDQGVVFYSWLLPAALLAGLAMLPGARIWLTSALVFIVALLPVLGLVPFGFQEKSTVADRYVYLAMLGPALALAALLARRRLEIPAVAGTVTVLAVLGALSFQQTSYWRNDEVLFTRALEVNPQSFSSHAILGRYYTDRRNWPQAIAQFDAALSLNPDARHVHVNLAEALAASGEIDAALREYEDVLAADPHFVRARNNLAILLNALGRKEEAMAHYREAIRSAPTFVEAHNNLGVLLNEQGKRNEAIRHFQEAVRLNPQAAPAHGNLAEALEAAGRRDEAVEHYRAALAQRPDVARWRRNLGLILFDQHQHAEAAEHLLQALEQTPDDTKAQRTLGEIYLVRRDYVRAKRQFELAAQLEPEDPAIWHFRGMAVGALGEVDAAAAMYRRSLELKPGWAPPANNLANLLANENNASIYDPEEAVELAETACRATNHRAPELLNTLAVAYYAADRMDDAIRTAEKGLELGGHPANAEQLRRNLEIFRNKLAQAEAEPAGETSAANGSDESPSPATAGASTDAAESAHDPTENVRAEERNLERPEPEHQP